MRLNLNITTCVSGKKEAKCDGTGGRGAILVTCACLLLTKTRSFLLGVCFPWRRIAAQHSEANYAALNETHMHKVDILYVGPRANGQEPSANLSPRGQTVVTSLAWCFLILPMSQASVRNTGVSPGHPRHGSRHSCNLNLSER